ncbi:VanZ like protein [Kribbella amoyensis]|uniref:VanZ like protein n=1 Tax=Kribbella amoyensis TaxID=996641 RepID=A0A561BYR4_9ACTN|nr:VanZ family protein [Kribbella amoyensis]TWD84040.1 VanZ like protein [Kribbella amoyensis]
MIIRDWQHLIGTFTGVAMLTVVLLPLAVLLVVALAYRRRADGRWAWRTSLADVGIVYGTLPWIWMTLLPGSGAGVVPGRVNLVPFRDLVTMSTGQVIGNLLIFAALGAFLPVRSAALASWARILVFTAGCSLLIEVAQYVLRLDRVSSVDDVLLNTAGAGLAAVVSRRWWRRAAGPDVVGISKTAYGSATSSRLDWKS